MKFPFSSTAHVLNRGKAPVAFLTELVTWARCAPDSLFEVNSLKDIYAKVKPELGPFTSLVQRKAVMLEVLRVLAGFESSWDWTEGVDTSKLLKNTPENAEAGAWQISYDSRNLHSSLLALVKTRGIVNGVTFQQVMKFDHAFAMEYTTQLLRVNTKHNGPLYKGKERSIIRKSLRGAEHSIYPWLRKEAVKEFAIYIG